MSEKSEKRKDLLALTAELWLLFIKVKREEDFPSPKSRLGELLLALFKVIMSVFYQFSEPAQLQLLSQSSFSQEAGPTEEQRRAVRERMDIEPGYKEKR